MKARKGFRIGRWGWIAGSVFAALALLWIAALAVLPPSRLTPLVKDGLARALHAPVALGEASLTLAPLPAVRLTHLVIFDPLGYVRPAAWPRGGVAQAGRVTASLDVFALFARRIAIQGATIEHARVTALRNERGIGNWEGLGGPAANAPPPGKSAFALSLDRLTLADVRVSTYDARDGAWFEAKRLDGTVSFRGDASGGAQRLKVAIDAQGLGGRTAWPIGARPVRLVADVEHHEPGGRWILHSAGVTRGALTLTGHGQVMGPTQELAFQLDQAKVPLDALLELLPRDQVKSLGDLAGKGDVRLALEATGPLAQGRTPSVRARVLLEGGQLAFKSRALAIEGLTLDLSATEQGATLARLGGRVGRSVFELTGDAADWADLRVRVHARANADLAEVARFLPLADSTKLGGRVDADISAAGRLADAASPGAAQAFGASGNIALHDVSASGLGLGVPVTGANGVIGLLPGQAFAKGLTLRAGRSNLALDGTIDRPWSFLDQLTGKASRPDPAAVAHFALRSPFLDGNELLPKQSSTAPLPRIRAEGTVTVDSLLMQKLATGRCAARVVYANGVTDLSDVSVAAYGGSATGQGNFDLADATHPHYTLHLAADGVDANRMLSAWSNVKNVAFGALKMTIDLDGTGFAPRDVAQSLTAKGLAQVLGGKLAGASVFASLAEFTGVNRFRILSFRDLSAPFHVTKGRVVFDPLAITTGATDWLAQGSVGLDGTLDFHIAALVPPSEAPGLPAGLLHAVGSYLDPSGRLTLDCLLGGTVTHPEFGWDAKRTLSRLVAQGPQAALAAVSKQVGGALADSLTRAAGNPAALAAALVAGQKQTLAAQLDQQKQALAQDAMSRLNDLFNQKRSAPAPPPPPPDTARADTARADTTHAAAH